jgi:spore coat polysaccharide biosynthesis protein SpsF (cytidylyltransferase family)
MTSKRFPGKVLAPFLNRPLLDHVVHQIKKSKIYSSIILATSTDNTDNPLASYAKELDLKVVRGSLDCVVDRYALALSSYSCDAFFRVCGDSPLLLPSLFNYAVSIYRDKRYDVITNIFPRTFPVGMSVELIKTEVFLKMKKNILSQEEKEHLSKYFYNNFSKYKIHNIECSSPIDQNLKLAVDEYNDLEKIELWLSDKKDKFENLFPIKISK